MLGRILTVKYATLAILMLVGTGLSQGLAEENPAAGTDGVFIHLSAGPDDPHRALMALKMASVMAEGGKPVLVYCDIEAVKLLVKNPPEVALDPFPPLAALLDTLASHDVLLRACPTCLKAAKLTPDALRDGVELADRDEFFSFTDGRILTLDY